SLREVLLTRVERLGAATRGVLRAIATIGRVCDESLIAEVTGLSPIELDNGLHEAVAHRLLVVSGEGYDVRHALLREALHAELLPGERARLHLAVAAALERRDEPAELARHWYAAGERGRALAAFVAAGTAAQETYAWAVAHAHYERALKLWPKVPEAESRCGLSHVDLLKRAAEAAMAEGDFEEAMGEGPTWCLYTLLGRIHWMAGDMADACAAYDEAIALLPEEDSGSARA